MLPMCCRFVAEMLPIFLAKLLIDNNVADVADFPTRNAVMRVQSLKNGRRRTE